MKRKKITSEEWAVMEARHEKTLQERIDFYEARIKAKEQESE